MDLDSSFHLLSFFPNREYGKVSINLILCWWKVKQDGVGFGATKRVRWLAIHTFLRGGGILFLWVEFSVLLFSHLVVSDSLRTHGLQHARLPFPSPSPRACSDPCPLSQWCHPTISSSVFPFSSCLQSFPESGSFPMSLFLASGGQSIGASASASVLPMDIQGWFPLGLTSLISLQSKGLSRVFSNTSIQKHQFFSAHLSLWSSSHIHTWLLEKP